MMPIFFAGPIFTDTEWYSILTSVFIMLSVLLATILFFARKLMHRKGKLKQDVTFIKSLVVSTSILGLTVIGVFVIPTMVKDSKWEKKQLECAKKVGYSSPADNNDPSKITAASQTAYRDCILN